MTKSKNILPYKPKHVWTDDEAEFLKANFADNFTEDLAKALNMSVSQVRNKACALGLKKSHQIRILSGKMSSDNPNVIASRFKPGHPPTNKGHKMTDEVRAKVKHTFFPKGHKPHNTRQGIGHLSKRSGYWYIKLADGKWRQLHTHTWETANRQINPKTEMVIFLDGNRDNCALENLQLLSRDENMRRNMIHRYPEELRSTIRTLNKFKRKISEYEKRHHGS